MYSFTEPEESIGELSWECIAYGETGIAGYLVYYKLLTGTAFGNDTGYKMTIKSIGATGEESIRLTLGANREYAFRVFGLMLENSVLPSTADDILYEINSYEALIATEKIKI